MVLAADDDLLRRRLRLALQHLCARIDEVPTSWDAMSLLLASGNQFDLLIGDLDLLSPTGLEAIVYARASGIAVPFLLITSSGRPSSHMDAARMGATFADKPIVASDLLGSVRRICRVDIGDKPSAA